MYNSLYDKINNLARKHFLVLPLQDFLRNSIFGTKIVISVATLCIEAYLLVECLTKLSVVASFVEKVRNY